jgi:hypothetical protein
MKYLTYLMPVVLSLFLSYYILLFIDPSFAHEDGVFETASAICFIIAAAFFFIQYWKWKSGNDLILCKTKKNILLLLLAIIFFVGFGEEISWGQRIFKIKTPEILTKINTQQEINIHNIRIFHGLDTSGNRKSNVALLLNVDRLFSLFWMVFCILIPISNKLSFKISKWLDRINLPIIPIWLGAFCLVNYLMSKIIEQYYPEIQYLVEIKEYNFAFIFMIISIYLLHKSLKRFNV